MTKPDLVNHPPHYTMGKHEIIDVIWNWRLPFCLGNAVKYIGRAEHKGNMIQDLEKAIFYLDYERNKTDSKRLHPLSTQFGGLLAVQEVIKDWKLGRRCGDALQSIFNAAHKGKPRDHLGRAAAELALKIDELRKKF